MESFGDKQAFVVDIGYLCLSYAGCSYHYIWESCARVSRTKTQSYCGCAELSH